MGVAALSRPTRRVSPNGQYHVVIRLLESAGFRSAEEYSYFCSQLRLCAEGFAVYAYCLLPHEIQLFLEEEQEGALPDLIRRLLTRYAGWYNRRHHRRGSVAEGRYLASPVQDGDGAYLVRYIHQAPLRAGLCKEVGAYPYSSYSGGDSFTVRREEWFPGGFVAFHQEREEQDFTIRPSGKLTPRQVKAQVDAYCREREIGSLRELDKAPRDEALRQLRERFSIGQLEAATGLSRSVIARCNQTAAEQPRQRAQGQMESFLL